MNFNTISTSPRPRSIALAHMPVASRLEASTSRRISQLLSISQRAPIVSLDTEHRMLLYAAYPPHDAVKRQADLPEGLPRLRAPLRGGMRCLRQHVS